MPTTTHADHKYSVTVHTDLRPALYCLRALSKVAQQTGNNQIPWGATKDKDWLRDNREVTFRFSSPSYRKDFLDLAKKILKDETWVLRRESNNDPAKPQN